MLGWDNDLKITAAGLFLDSCTPRLTCFVSHAHSDHIALHGRSLCSPKTAALCAHRLRFGKGLPGVRPIIEPVGYGERFSLDADTLLQLSPAGHVLGSSMLHVTRPEGTLLYTGDFTLQSSLTAEAANPPTADCLVMETTYGLPCFRFPPRELVMEQLLTLVRAAMRQGRQPIVLGYSLGKAQEVTRILTDAGFNVTLHGAPHALAGIYESQEMPLGRFRRYRYEDFHGEAAIDLEERGVLVAPPHVARTSFISRFEDAVTIMMTGWALLKGATYRYGVNHALPLSDHADFDGLMELIERVKPVKVYTHHGYTREFAEHLEGMGIAACPAEPDAQLSLFK